MICPRCKTPMKEEKRSFHKKRKWVCPACGRVRMQQPKRRRGEKRRRKHRGKDYDW